MCLLKTPIAFRQYHKRRLQGDHGKGRRLYDQPYGIRRSRLREKSFQIIALTTLFSVDTGMK